MNPTLISEEQLEICKKYGSPAVPAPLEEKLGIAINTLHLVPTHGVRLKPENGTCGWYIWGGDYSEDPDFYQAMHVSHINEVCPQVAKYLALAPGFRFIIDPEGYEDVWFEEHQP